MGRNDVSAYILEANRVQGSIAERERAAKLKREEFMKMVQELPEDLCSQLETQYGISIRKFLEVDMETLTEEELQKLKEEANQTIDRIKLILDRTFKDFRGE